MRVSNKKLREWADNHAWLVCPNRHTCWEQDRKTMSKEMYLHSLASCGARDFIFWLYKSGRVDIEMLRTLYMWHRKFPTELISDSSWLGENSEG